MRLVTRFMCVILSMIICATITGNSIIVCANDDTINVEEQQIFSTATINDNFADDRVIVVFKNKNSLEFVDYTVNCFPEINCNDVRVLTHESLNEVKTAMESKLSTASEGENSKIHSDIDLFNTTLCITLKETGKDRVIEAIEKLRERDDVLYVGPDMVINIESTESEYVSYSEPDDVRNRIQLNLLPQSYENSFGVTVGIIDSGIDMYHPAFNGVNFDYGNSYDYVEDIAGIRAINDQNGHGTHVAGIIAGAINTSLDFSGVIPGVTLVSWKVFNASGEGYLSDLIDAIEAADACGVRILNYSGGAEVDIYSVSNYLPLHNAIQLYDGLFICSAGNDSLNNDLSVNHHYPSDYDDLTNLIAVGASDLDDNVCDFSNYGAIDVDLFAPGELILSAYPESMCTSLGICTNTEYHKHVEYGYHAKTGTSMATPFVTGVAAILLFYDYTLETNEIRNYILESVDPCATLQGKCSTGGRLNAYNAVSSLIDECSHSDISYINNGNTHTMRCNLCNYQEILEHSLYVFSDNGESGVTIKCYQCDFVRFCDIGVAEYGYGGSGGHYVDCTCGCYSFFTAHIPQFIMQTSSLYTHNVHCRDCNTVYPDAHSWIPSGLGYECVMCGMSSLTIPGIMQIPPDDELLLGSSDDIITDDALLPGKEDDLVTE